MKVAITQCLNLTREADTYRAEAVILRGRHTFKLGASSEGLWVRDKFLKVEAIVEWSQIPVKPEMKLRGIDVRFDHWYQEEISGGGAPMVVIDGHLNVPRDLCKEGGPGILTTGLYVRQLGIGISGLWSDGYGGILGRREFFSWEQALSGIKLGEGGCPPSAAYTEKRCECRKKALPSK